MLLLSVVLSFYCDNCFLDFWMAVHFHFHPPFSDHDPYAVDQSQQSVPHGELEKSPRRHRGEREREIRR